MRLKPLIMIALAIVFGGSAMLVGNAWIQRQAALNRPVASAAPVELPRSTIVVAAARLRFGDELVPARLKEIAWLGSDLPAGSYATIAELLRGGPRLALGAIEPSEPVLKGKITGEGQRATLSSLISDDMGAVTVQVDEVVGIAGFVLPGDRVDVLLTQHQNSEAGSNVFNDRILQNVRVLAVGQAADERLDKPTLVRSVTLEVDAVGAQKVALATKLGSLSLVLRRAGETALRTSRRVGAGEIMGGVATDSDATTVQVTRGQARTAYSVQRAKDEALPDMPFSTGNVRRGPPAADATPKSAP